MVMSEKGDNDKTSFAAKLIKALQGEKSEPADDAEASPDYVQAYCTECKQWYNSADQTEAAQHAH
jgi:hypothetical protein